MDPEARPKSEPRDDASSPAPPRKKQKRNKPTLSCEECVERKTKVSRQVTCASRRDALDAQH